MGGWGKELEALASAAASSPRAVWFQAFVGAMPKGLLTTEQLQKIRQDNKDDTDQYPALKTLILETYANINAHQQARKKFEEVQLTPKNECLKS